MLKRQHITQTFENITDLVGSSIFVAVTVLTDNGKNKRNKTQINMTFTDQIKNQQYECDILKTRCICIYNTSLHSLTKPYSNIYFTMHHEQQRCGPVRRTWLVNPTVQ